MIRRPPISTSTSTLFPNTTLFRALADRVALQHPVGTVDRADDADLGQGDGIAGGHLHRTAEAQELDDIVHVPIGRPHAAFPCRPPVFPTGTTPLYKPPAFGGINDRPENRRRPDRRPTCPAQWPQRQTPAPPRRPK